MWVTKIKVDGTKFLLGSKAKKFGIDMVGQPLSYSKNKKNIVVIAAGTISGKEEDKQAFLNDLKKDKTVKRLETKKDFLIGTMLQPIISEPLYDPEIIHIKPMIISKDGKIIWELASWERKKLEKIIRFASKYFGGELLNIKKDKIGNLAVLNILPGLTDKQKESIELAIKNGYYEVPKKITLKELAKQMNLSFSTYQAHLSRAEKKLMPDLIKRL